MFQNPFQMSYNNKFKNYFSQKKTRQKINVVSSLKNKHSKKSLKNKFRITQIIYPKELRNS